MAVSYNKLWNLVRQNKMKKRDLARAAEISGYAMQRLNHDEPVQMEVMLRLCKVFHCDIGDLMEVIENDSSREETENYQRCLNYEQNYRRNGKQSDVWGLLAIIGGAPG